MRKTGKIIYGVIGGVILLILVLVSFIGVATLSSYNYSCNQNDYFSKSEYEIEGKVIDSRVVGGNYHIINLRPTKFALFNNNINTNDDHIGVYARDTSIVIMIAALPEKFTSPLEQISISTINRQIVLNDSSTNTLRTADLYKRNLPHGDDYIPF